ncbi:MAG: pyrroloquinoline quinone-dependent dehydrogenase [Pseudomonadales bacterium]|nr:pyrroloquinoline quinone-dependent dehydrogenase [Pseudomonadales bacterium]MCP5358605.1 pyrroloquinoline quinone-dependent dehydrogenase [Pseudomonadales bacterium]
MSTSRRHTAAILFTVTALSISVGAVAQQGARDGQWSSYAGDAGSTKYSSLDQINADNFAALQPAWRWQSLDGSLNFDDIDREVSFGRMQGTPLMVDGVLYMITSLNQVVALDAASGETLWSFNPEIYRSGGPVGALGFHQRGVAYWRDGDEARILVATQDGFIYSLRAEDGSVDTGFASGRVDMTDGIPRAVRGELDWQGAPPLGAVSPPIVVGDILVVSQITSNRPRYKERPPLWIRGYNIRTGELAWTFHTIPLEGEFGNETWEEDSWRTAGNGGVWSMMSADLELGYVYLPTEAATNDFYGGHRPGDNLFTESLVCLDARTGERVWHFQMVHHGIWDFDNPAAPNLIDIEVDGRKIKAVAQVTKQGFTYVFDRVTGEPVWPIPETPVPQSDFALPGEHLSPTQPIPSKPPAFARQGIDESDLVDFTPEIRAEAEEILKQYTYGPLFTPPTLSVPGGNRGTLILPGAGGGANWTGAGVDPEHGILYVPSSESPNAPLMTTLPAEESNFNFLRLSNQSVRGPRGLPLLKPPYATITAIDMNKGEILWQQANGEDYAPVSNHPDLAGMDLPPLGGGGRQAVLVTSTLLIHAQTTLDGAVLVARDKMTGEELQTIPLPANGGGAPMTYEIDGKQYIVLSILSNPVPELIAFALP